MNEYTQPRSDEERRAREGWLCNMGVLLGTPVQSGIHLSEAHAAHMADEPRDPTEIDWLRLNREFS